MSLVFKTPKSALNTTTGTLQNIKSGDCPAPSLTTESVEYTENGEYSVTTPQGYDGLSGVSVTVNVPSDIHNQEKTATPTTSSQEIIADSGYSGLSKVTVSAVTSSIDANIQADNIKNGVSILGVSGTYDPQPNLQSKSATPTTSSQTIQPDSGYDGLSQVTVGAVTSAIDQNITAGNIKSGVSILGVNGSYDPQPELQAKTVNPSTSQQTVSPDQGKDGLSSVTVNAVTSSIDANIQSGNILDGVTILGVTGTAVEANLESATYDSEMVGSYTITPDSRYNGFDEVNVVINSEVLGTFYDPFELADQGILRTLYVENEEGTFDGMDVYFSMEVETGSIDSRTGNYIAEDADGNLCTIVPYVDNPDYDPEQPDDPITNPEYIFPDDFDLSGLFVQVTTPWESVTITENAPADPNEETIYTVEIDECRIVGINYNGDSESWAFGTLEIDQNGVFDPKGFAEIEVNVSGTQCPDWSSIGWDCNDVTDSGLAADVAYTAQKKAEYEGGTITNFQSDTNLIFLPNITLPSNSNDMFKGCANAKYFPVFDGSPTLVNRMFQGAKLNKQPVFDWSNVTSATQTFANCNLTSVDINAPSLINGIQLFDSNTKLTTANITVGTSLESVSNMFAGCWELTTVSLFNTSNVSYMSSMFIACSKLITSPAFNTSNVTQMDKMFDGCWLLQTVPLFDTSKVTTTFSMFRECRSLTTLGGFTNLGKAFTGTNANNHTLDLSASTVLTYQSIMNVINNLAAPDDTAVSNATLILSATSYALLSASDIAVATAKNWTVTSA